MNIATARLAPLAACAFAVAAGIGHMAIGHAPASYMAVNAAALLMAGLLALPASRVSQPRAATGILALLLALPLLLDPFSGEIRRWIVLGPVSLHAGMLVLPALLALAARSPRGWVLAVGFASAIAAVEPDRAIACALLCAALALASRDRSPSSLLAVALAAAGLAATLIRPDPLEPVAFVERVIRDAWQADRWMAPLLALALAAAVLLPALRFSRSPGALAFTACLAGFTLAALLGAYPFPLIGYGASAILGYGLALRFVRHTPEGAAA